MLRVSKIQQAAMSNTLREIELLEELPYPHDRRCSSLGRVDVRQAVGRIGGDRRVTTDTSEKGLERLICTVLTGHPCDPPQPGSQPYMGTGGVGWTSGNPADYDRVHCLDLAQLTDFLRFTQSEAARALRLGDDNPTRRKFLARVESEITKRGTIDVLRNGVKHGPHHLDLFYGTPSPDNEKAKVRFEQNRFTVTQPASLQRGRDSAVIGSGADHQRTSGAHVRVEEQPHQTDRERRHPPVPPRPRSRGRSCIRSGPVFGALCGGRHASLLLHPPPRESVRFPSLQSEGGAMELAILPIPTVWRSTICGERVLSRESLTNIIENYAQLVGKGSDRQQIWPRYHQLDVVRKLLADAGRRNWRGYSVI